MFSHRVYSLSMFLPPFQVSHHSKWLLAGSFPKVVRGDKRAISFMYFLFIYFTTLLCMRQGLSRHDFS